MAQLYIPTSNRIFLNVHCILCLSAGSSPVHAGYLFYLGFLFKSFNPN